MSDPNPFDLFDSEAAPALSAGNIQPSLTERFIANYKQAIQSGSPEGALGEYLRQHEKASEEGFADPTEAAKAAIKERDFAYSHIPWSDTALDWIAAGAGQVAGTMSTPSSWLYAPIRVGGAVARAAGPLVSRIVEHGAGAAVSNAAQDAATQGVRVGVGVQDSYDPKQTAIAAGAGAALGGAVGGVTSRGADVPTVAERQATNAEAPSTAPARDAGNIFDRFDNDNAPATEVAAARVQQPMAARVGPETGDSPVLTPERQDLAAPTGLSENPVAKPNLASQGDVTPEFQAAARQTQAVNPRDAQGIAGATGDEVMRLEDIGRFLQDAAPEGTAFRQGRLMTKPGARVLGQFGTNSGVVRLRTVSDIPTFTHEVGHAFEAKFKGPLDALKQQHSSELMQWAPPSGYKPNQLLSEGFAEYLRELVTRPAVAQQKAPAFTAAFESFMKSSGPDSFDNLMRAQQAYGKWLHAPSNDITVTDVITTGGKGPIDRFRETMQKEGGFAGAMGAYYRSFYTGAVDQLHPINVAVDRLLDASYRNTGTARDLKAANNAYKLARLATHASNAGFRDLMEGVVPYKGIAPAGPSISAAIEHAIGSTDLPFEKGANQFGDYLASRRMIEEYGRYMRGEIPNPPGKFTLGDYRQSVADYEARFPQFAQAAHMAYEFQNNLLRKKFESGFLTQEQFDAFGAMKDYVPLMRDMRDFGEEVGTKAGSGAAKASGTGSESIVKRFKGSQRSVINPLESIMRDAIETSNLIARNDTFKALDDLARLAGPGGGEIVERIPRHEMTATKVSVREAIEAAAKEMNVHPRDAATLGDLADATLGENATALIFRPGEINERGEPIVYVWRNGERQPLRLADGDFGRDLYQAMTLIGVEKSSPLLDVLAMGSQALRMGVTTDLSFIFANLARDMLSAWVLEGVTPGSTQVRGLVHALKGDEVSSLYGRAGGMMGGSGAAALDKARFKRDISSLREKGFLAEHLTSLQGFVRLTEFSESATRLGLFEKAFERAKGNGLTEHEALIEAAYTARDLIDFGRNGSKTLAARKAITFLNAAVQGLDKAVRALGGEGSLARALAPYLG